MNQGSDPAIHQKMITFNVPKKEDVSEQNRALFNQLEKALGFVPNLYATYAYSDHALGNYLTLNQAKSSLSNKEKEVVNLAVSQVNECRYCLAAHTAIGKMNGFTEAETLELRAGKASFDARLNALAALSRNLVQNRGAADQELLEAFFNEGWTEENLVDTIVLVGDKTISNYLHRATQIPVDFPEAQPLELQTA